MAITHTSPTRVLSASTITGDTVVNAKAEKLGKIEDLMIDLERGTVAYAVLSFGGMLGMGGKFFAIPWSALRVDTVEKRVVLDQTKEILEAAPGFDKDHWPDMADQTWGATVHTYYGSKPSWE